MGIVEKSRLQQLSARMSRGSLEQLMQRHRLEDIIAIGEVHSITSADVHCQQ
jgi:hypothetical protein